MDIDPNPYSPPQVTQLASSLMSDQAARAARQRKLALAILLFTIFVSLVSTALDDMVIQARIGPWPIIALSAAIALLSSILTRDRILAPLTCCGAIMTSAGFVAITHDLRYAQLHIAMPIALSFSVPALFMSLWLRRK